MGALQSSSMPIKELNNPKTLLGERDLPANPPVTGEQKFPEGVGIGVSVCVWNSQGWKEEDPWSGQRRLLQ